MDNVTAMETAIPPEAVPTITDDTDLAVSNTDTFNMNAGQEMALTSKVNKELSNNGSDPNEYRDIWTGCLLWNNEQIRSPDPAPQVESGEQDSYNIPCRIYMKIEEKPEFTPKTWGKYLYLHLVSKKMVTSLDVALLEQTFNVFMSFSNSPGRAHLTKLLRTGRYVGCIHVKQEPWGSESHCHFDEYEKQLCPDDKVIIVMFSRPKKRILGFVPFEQNHFISEYLKAVNHRVSIVLSSVDPKNDGVHDQLDVSSKSLPNPDLDEVQGDMEVDISQQGTYTAASYFDYSLNEFRIQDPIVVTNSDEFQRSNLFLKGCKWAPDGSCLLTNSDDDILRLFNLPESCQTVDTGGKFDNDKTSVYNSVLKVNDGGQIYDFCWYPLMSSYNPQTACFLSTSKDAPVHLWDAFTGELRATYLTYNHLDVPIAASSLAFSINGDLIYCGYNGSISIFDITRPGRDNTVRKLKHETFPYLNQPGIVSCISVNPKLSSVYAVGTYRKTIGIYHDNGDALCILEGHLGGVTHLKFSQDGTKLFSGGRKDSRLICWDMRFMGEEYRIYDRVVETNQRIYFDTTMNDKYLVSGGTDGTIKVWNVKDESENPCLSWEGSPDCVNGVSINPFLPLLASTSGQRHVNPLPDDDLMEDLKTDHNTKEASVKIWRFGT